MVEKKEMEEVHWKAVMIMIDVFITFVEGFKRTAPGVRYYVNCTSEQDAETHKDLAKNILETLRNLKNADIGAYYLLP